MKCLIVSHTHWDREWYRTFQAFRARLVDTVDRVLELIDADPGFCFLLDGQTIVVEDYLEIRPGQREALARACGAGRLAIGPWYVQPDSLLPSGEAHVRNLLEGARTAEAVGATSRVAYTPDSFGHPAQFPQLFRGFGLGLFVYWRGNGNEVHTLPAEYLWEAPDGSTVCAHHLSEGYFAACGLPADPDAAADFLADLTRTLARRTRGGCVLLMNGIDHAPPQAQVGAAAARLAQRTGWSVRRGLLEDLPVPGDLPRYAGELTGARTTNLLPGVWSARLPLKLRNRRAEMMLEAWAEPWSALGNIFGTALERPALRVAWRALLQNQAHDSICGCSHDRVHEQMQTRYDTAEELATETTRRLLEQLAGLGLERRTPTGPAFDLAVFNPSPHPRTDVVRFLLDPAHWFEFGGETVREMTLHAWLHGGASGDGFAIDGTPVRLFADETPGRLRLTPELPAQGIEFVATDVPAFGWRRFGVTPGVAQADHEDDAREIACGDVWVRVADDGTLDLRTSRGVYTGLCAVEDIGDRGDTYDCDPLHDGPVVLEKVHVHRRVHASGLQYLTVQRTFRVPAHLSPDRTRRSENTVSLVLETEARVAPGVERLDLRVRLDNTARDHRLRLLFPTRRPSAAFTAATTLDVARRETRRRDDAGWVHPAPATFVQQGFVNVNGLTVSAPGLPEAEVTPDGVIAITLLRAVGWLARMDLTTRPQPAGPAVETPGAQCQQRIDAQLALLVHGDPRSVQDAERGLQAVAAGSTPRLPSGRALLRIEPREVLLSALKPAEAGDGFILRLLNPTDAAVEAKIQLGFSVARIDCVQLDERPIEGAFSVQQNTVFLPIPGHALRSLRMQGCATVSLSEPTLK